MAEAADIALVREYVAEPDTNGAWTDARIEGFVDREVNLYYAAAEIWGVKAGQSVGLVNVAESGSSRSLSDLLKQAKEMEAYYRRRGDELESPVPADAGPVIRRISRAR